MYMQNDTGRSIATAIGNIDFDTSGLMKDTTGQSINTTLGQIKTVLEGVAAPEAEDVIYDNTASGLAANNVQAAVDELSSEKQDSLMGGTLSGPDFNDLTENKNYTVNTTGSLNAPVTPGYGYLEVIVVFPTIIMQRFTRFTSSGSEMCRTYVRQYINSQWYSWIQIY